MSEAVIRLGSVWNAASKQHQVAKPGQSTALSVPIFTSFGAYSSQMREADPLMYFGLIGSPSAIGSPSRLRSGFLSNAPKVSRIAVGFLGLGIENWEFHFVEMCVCARSGP